MAVNVENEQRELIRNAQMDIVVGDLQVATNSATDLIGTVGGFVSSLDVQNSPSSPSATATYKEESDPLGDFLSERCIEGAGFEVKASAVYVAYRSWAEDEGIRDRDVMSNKVFGIRMTARFTKLARKTGKVYLGVGLRETRSMTEPGDGSGDGS